MQVPDGFSVEKIAGYPLIHRPVFACLDEAGNLYVGESNGENLTRQEMLEKKPHWITRLEDTNGDGVYDKSSKFVENITLPQGCLWYRGSLYVTCPPSIMKFTDTDGDGRADKQEEILTGFGFSGNACDTHGPFLSPSGRLYIVEGRHGHEFKDKNGVVYSKGKAGRIFSCTPDGDDVRVHAGGGFDNPVEVDFTDEGECIGTANIVYRDRGDCLLHWVEGGVYPREDQADAVAEFKRTGDLLGPVHNLGHVAVSGITRYRGQQFGSEFSNRWFYAEFNTHRVRYSELKRVGSTYTADVHDFLHCEDGDFHPTDVLEDADGSLLVLNTGGWFRNGCPTSRIAKPEIYGTVHRVRKTGAPVAKSSRTDVLPANGAPQTLVRETVSRLNSARPEVREQTVHWLRTRPDVRALLEKKIQLNELISTTENGTDLITVPVYSGWLRSTTEDPLATALVAARINEFPDWKTLPEDKVAAATAVAQITLQHARDLVWTSPLSREISTSLFRNLADAPLPVFRAGMEFAATLCLDRITPVITIDGNALKQFVLATAERPMDRVAEHSFIFALIQLQQSAALIDILASNLPAAQKAALIALDQLDNSPLQRQMVIPLLSVQDASLQKAALDVIARRDGWGAETLTVLKGWLDEPQLSTERTSAISSFLTAQLNDAAVQTMVAEQLAKPSTSAAVKLLLWEVLQKSTIAAWPKNFGGLVRDGLHSQTPEIQIAALRVVNQRKLTDYEADIKQLSRNTTLPLTVRCEAVAACGMSGLPLEETVFTDLVQKLVDRAASSDEKSLVGRAIGSSLLRPEQLVTLTTTFDAAGPLIVPTLVKAFSRSADEPAGQALIAALLKSNAAVSVAPDELAALLRKYPGSVRTAAEPLFKKLGVDAAAQEARLAELAPLLNGGNAVAGRDVFFGQKAACSSCHAIGAQGGRVGPHLSTIGVSRSPQDLLEAIVFPSASFVNGYRTTMVATVDGRVLQGVISAETSDTITLRTQDLQEIRLRRDDIEEQRESSTSIMPVGLDRQLTPQELRDLLAFLQSKR